MRKQLMGLLVPVFVFAAMTNAAAGDMTGEGSGGERSVAEDRDRATPDGLRVVSSKPRARWHPRCQLLESPARIVVELRSRQTHTCNGDGAERTISCWASDGVKGCPHRDGRPSSASTHVVIDLAGRRIQARSVANGNS